jgi:uncharacterized protein (DUF1684 family)
MKSSLALALFALALALAGPALAATPPQRLTTAERDSLTRAAQQDRTDTDESLKAGPTSYFAAVSRVDFAGQPSLVVGSAPDCGVAVKDPAMPAHALRVTVVGDSFHVEVLDPALAVTAGKATIQDAVLPPSQVRLGRWAIRLSHQRFPALIVFDPQSPRFAEFKPTPYFPVDFGYRFAAPLTPNPKADTVIILSTRGNERRALKVGWFDLEVKGKAVRLEAHRLLEPGVDEKSVSVFFRDATTGRESYGVGRYVDPEPLPDGRWLLDFNNAYNPACAYSPFYNCPIPSKANTLKVPIRAGAMDPHILGH